MKISVPHYKFGFGGRFFWIDSYFPAYLEYSFRISALVRSEANLFPEGVVLEPSFHPEELKDFIIDSKNEIESVLKSVSLKRARIMGKWSILRSLLLPSGFKRKVMQDEELVKFERELRMAFEILSYLTKSEFLNEIGYLNLDVENNLPKDDVYLELFRVDEGFRKKFAELIQ